MRPTFKALQRRAIVRQAKPSPRWKPMHSTIAQQADWFAEKLMKDPERAAAIAGALNARLAKRQ